MSDEFRNDDGEEYQKSKYRCETFIFAINTALTTIRTHFSSHRAILWDFALLDPERFQELIQMPYLKMLLKMLAKITAYM